MNKAEIKACLTEKNHIVVSYFFIIKDIFMKNFKLLSAVLALSCALQVSQCLGSDLVGICKSLTQSEQKELNRSLKAAGGLARMCVAWTVIGLALDYGIYSMKIRDAEERADYRDVTRREDIKRREMQERLGLSA